MGSAPGPTDGTDDTDGVDGVDERVGGVPAGLDLSEALDSLEVNLLGAAPSLTRVEVVEQAGVPAEMAAELWRLLGFVQQSDDEVAFTAADVQALEYADDLMGLGILSPERQAALVRTWGRSYARLAEWQTSLLADIALSSDDPVRQIESLNAEVLPRLESLQNYVWRRHLLSASNRLLAGGRPGGESTPLAVVFCDIVGFTSRSKELDDAQLIGWLENFESTTAGAVVDHGGRIIKNIGDEVLFVNDDLDAAARTALELVARGSDRDDGFPEVRAGLAYGDVVARLGDVFGPTVNIAARLTSIARPGTVLVDRGAHQALTAVAGRGRHTGRSSGSASAGTSAATSAGTPPVGSPYQLRRLPRTSVKGYAHLQSWALRSDG